MDGIVYFYKAQKPTFTFNSTSGEMTINLPANPRGWFIEMHGKKETIPVYGKPDYPGASTVTLVNRGILIYNIDTNSFEVTNQDGIIEPYARRSWIFCCQNENGYVQGPWRHYQLSEDINNMLLSANNYTDLQINNLDTSQIIIPEYYQSHLENKEKDIRTKIANAGINGDAFIFITDIHYETNTKHSEALIKHICKNTPISKVIHGGDLINSVGGANWEPALEYMKNIIYKYSNWNFSTYFIAGNHEFNNPGASTDPAYVARQLTREQLSSLLSNGHNNDCVYDNTSIAFYWDDKKTKTRYFTCHCIYSSGVDADSVKFVVENLNTTPNDYDIILFTHNGFTHQWYLEAFRPIYDAFHAYINHSTFTYNGTTYDYSNKNGTIIGAFGGHYHMDGAFKSYANYILTTTDNCNQENQESSLTRTSGTITEQAFDVVIINKQLRKIQCVRIGAGEDREFTY